MKIKYIVYLALVILLGGFVTYRIIENKVNKGSGKEKAGGASQIQVNGIVVEPHSFANILSVSGSIEANEQVDIQGEVSGLVEAIYFEEGRPVKKGQVLLKVNDTELRAQASQVLTKQDLAAENERRAALLLQKEAISQEEYDVAKAELKSTQAQSQLIQAQIFKTSVKAPFAGIIGLRSISPGSYITPTTIIAKLVNTSNLKITFSIPEKYSALVKINTTIRFTVPGSGKKNEAVIYAIDPAIETTTRTLKLRALAKNTDGTLLPGSFANIELPLNKTDSALLVPTEAVIPVQNGKKVFIVQHGKAKEVMVQTSTRTEKVIFITSGLKAGDTVLTTGVMTLKNGTPVKVTASKNQ